MDEFHESDSLALPTPYSQPGVPGPYTVSQFWNIVPLSLRTRTHGVFNGIESRLWVKHLAKPNTVKQPGGGCYRLSRDWRVSKHLNNRDMVVEEAPVGHDRPMTRRARAIDSRFPADTRSDDLFSWSRRRLLEPGRVPIFTLGQFWPVDTLCIEAEALYRVVVYVVFEAVEDMHVCWKQLQSGLAVNATTYHSKPEGGGDGRFCIALLFSVASPLVGPMSYAEVQRAAEHYLGWCSSQDGENPWWNPRRQSVTVELVERSAVKEWISQRQCALEGTGETISCRGLGFRCRTPCKPFSVKRAS